jgi:hypothetical protein
VSCPSQSGRAVSWLLERSSDVNCVSCPSESGRVVKLVAGEIQFCQLRELSQGVWQFSKFHAAEGKFCCARFQGLLDFLFGLLICFIFWHCVRLCFW